MSYSGYRHPSPERCERQWSGAPYGVREAIDTNPRVSPPPRRPIDGSAPYETYASTPGTASPYAYSTDYGTPGRDAQPTYIPSPRTPVSYQHVGGGGGGGGVGVGSPHSPLAERLAVSTHSKVQEVEKMKSRTEQLRRETATLRRTLANYSPEQQQVARPQPTSPREYGSIGGLGGGVSKTNNEAIGKLTSLVTELRRQLDQARSESCVDELRRSQEKAKSLELELELSRLAQPSKPEELLVAQQTVKAQSSSLEQMRLLCNAQQEKIDSLANQESRISKSTFEVEDLNFRLREATSSVAAHEGRESALRAELESVRRAMDHQNELVSALKAENVLLRNKVENSPPRTPPVSTYHSQVSHAQPEREASPPSSQVSQAPVNMPSQVSQAHSHVSQPVSTASHIAPQVSQTSLPQQQPPSHHATPASQPSHVSHPTPQASEHMSHSQPPSQHATPASQPLPHQSQPYTQASHVSDVPHSQPPSHASHHSTQPDIPQPSEHVPHSQPPSHHATPASQPLSHVSQPDLPQASEHLSHVSAVPHSQPPSHASHHSTQPDVPQPSEHVPRVSHVSHSQPPSHHATPASQPLSHVSQPDVPQASEHMSHVSQPPSQHATPASQPLSHVSHHSTQPDTPHASEHASHAPSASQQVSERPASVPDASQFAPSNPSSIASQPGNPPSSAKPPTPQNSSIGEYKVTADDSHIVVPAGLSFGWFKPPPGYPQPPASIKPEVMKNKDAKAVESEALPEPEEIVAMPDVDDNAYEEPSEDLRPKEPILRKEADAQPSTPSETKEKEYVVTADDSNIVVPAGLSFGWFKPPPGYPQPPASIKPEVMKNKDAKTVESEALPEPEEIVAMPDVDDNAYEEPSEDLRPKEPILREERDSSPDSFADSACVTPPQRTVLGEEHSPAEKVLVDNLHITCEFSDGIETDRSMSATSFYHHHSQQRQARLQPIFHVAAMIGEGGGPHMLPGLMSLVHAAPAPMDSHAQDDMTDLDDSPQRGFYPSQNEAPLALSLPADLHEELKSRINAEEVSLGDGLKILHVSSPRSKMEGLDILESAGHQVKPSHHLGLEMLVLASPRRSESPGLDALVQAASM